MVGFGENFFLTRIDMIKFEYQSRCLSEKISFRKPSSNYKLSVEMTVSDADIKCKTSNFVVLFYWHKIKEECEITYFF